MGFSISWIAFKDVDKVGALDRAKLHDLGVEDEANETPFSIAQLPTGWTVIFSNDFDFGSKEHILALSRGIEVVSCQVEEHVMFSAAFAAKDGKSEWAVWHDAQRGVRDLSTEGTLPADFEATRHKLLAAQAAEDAGSGEVDHVFEMPVELAFDMTGYRHDLWDFPWGPRPRFTSAGR